MWCKMEVFYQESRPKLVKGTFQHEGRILKLHMAVEEGETARSVREDMVAAAKQQLGITG